MFVENDLRKPKTIDKRNWILAFLVSLIDCCLRESRDKLRVRLRSMSDQELLSFSLTAKYMASQQAEFGQFGQSFLTQIEEARAEWKRRMPDLP